MTKIKTNLLHAQLLVQLMCTYFVCLILPYCCSIGRDCCKYSACRQSIWIHLAMIGLTDCTVHRSHISL